MLDIYFQVTDCKKSTATVDFIGENIIRVAKDAFVCAICDHKSKLRCNARKHIRVVHLKERKHNCSYCNASFQQKSNLKSHERICKAKPQSDESQAY